MSANTAETNLPPDIPAHDLCRHYSRLPASYDEMWDENGQVRKHWETYRQAIRAMGCDELERCHQEALRMLRQNGITYNIHGDPHGVHRYWKLDAIPLILKDEDWAAVESGLKQRARIMDLILADIYGPRTLFREKLLPVELIYHHSGFLRQWNDVKLPAPRQLLLYGADLARGPDQRMWVMNDHSQNPTGIGYTLENRTAMAHVFSGLFRECRVQRLSNFFRALRAGLAAVAPNRKESPRIVILTPGPGDETYFEHAYLAAYLGYPLVQGDDLTVRDGYVWLKSLEGLQLVDVILRQVDDVLCDPLELSQESRQGVAGLLEAARRGNVVLANPPGAGVLENPGLLAFLPGIARHFLQQDLILPSAATWWCGQKTERDYVLEHLGRLVIKSIHRSDSPRTVLGPNLSAAEQKLWKERIEAHPHRYVGQEMVRFSSAPVLTEGRLVPRHSIFRSFLTSQNDDYAVMPGGIARSAADHLNTSLTNPSGGIFKDTWITTSKPHRHVSLWLRGSRVGKTLKGISILPSRAAENLFWVGRYAERAEAIARVLRTILHLYTEGDRFGDEADLTCIGHLLDSLLQMTLTRKDPAVPPGQLRPEKEIPVLVLDMKQPGSLSATLQSLLNATYSVRDRWSTDTWRVVNDIEEHWTALQQLPGFNPPRMLRNLDQLITALMAFAGLCMESMSRESGWVLLDIGRRIERALMFIDFIQANLVKPHETQMEHLILEAMLVTTENIITYRRRYRSYMELETVLDLLLLDEKNPRSLGYQLKHLQEHIGQLPREPQVGYRLSEEEQFILKAYTRLRLCNTAMLTEMTERTATMTRLDGFLAGLRGLLTRTSETISQTYFSHTQESQHLNSRPSEPE